MANMKDNNDIKLTQVFLTEKSRKMLRLQKTIQRKSISLIVDELIQEKFGSDDNEKLY